jgi:hypothetical protein
VALAWKIIEKPLLCKFVTGLSRPQTRVNLLQCSMCHFLTAYGRFATALSKAIQPLFSSLTAKYTQFIATWW